MSDEKFSFEEIFKQNEKRIHFQIMKLGIYDEDREFYLEGLYAMWMAYKKHDPNKGPMATYFNYTIRNRMIDLLRKKTRQASNEEKVYHEKMCEVDNGNVIGTQKLPVVDPSGVEVADDAFWDRVKSKLTANQWKWVQYHIIEGMRLPEIARQEGVSAEAVKSWGREARRKLRPEADVLARLSGTRF